MSYNLQEMTELDSSQKLSKKELALRRAVSLDNLISKGAHFSDSIERGAAEQLLKARKLRQKYAFKRMVELWEEQKPVDASIEYSYRQNDEGIFEVTLKDSPTSIFPVPNLSEYVIDHKCCETIVQSKAVKSLCAHRLTTMNQLFDMYCHMSWKREEELSEDDHSDFFSIAKVDTHIHLSAAFAPKDLLDYMRKVMSSLIWI